MSQEFNFRHHKIITNSRRHSNNNSTSNFILCVCVRIYFTHGSFFSGSGCYSINFTIIFSDSWCLCVYLMSVMCVENCVCLCCCHSSRCDFLFLLLIVWRGISSGLFFWLGGTLPKIVLSGFKSFLRIFRKFGNDFLKILINF